jgi:large subunit ribosomal protein L7/L12
MADETTTAEAATPEVAPVAEQKVESKVELPVKFKDIVASVEKMSVLELHELVKALEGHWGVSAAAVAVAGSGAAGGEAAEEKSSFNVHLTDAGAQRVQVIKAIKDALSLGLKEAKDLVDAVPTVIKEGMKKEDADKLKAAVEAAGGKVELK